MADKDFEKGIENQKRSNREQSKHGRPPKAYNLVKDYSENQNKPPKGNKYGTCKECGKQFEHEFSEDRNAYSSHRICPECRKIKSIRQQEKIERAGGTRKVYSASLQYTPHPWQVEAEEAFHNHRFIVLACGNRCLLPGSFINGCDKLIEDVKPGDLCINKFGWQQKVLSVDREQYQGDVYTVKAVGIVPIRCNSEHPFMVSKFKNGKVISEQLVLAKDLIAYHGKIRDKNNYLKIPRIKGNNQCNWWPFEKFEKNLPNQLDGLPLNEETAWMIGLYCAEGCYLNHGGSCKWTLNFKEPEISKKLCAILDKLNLYYNVREREAEGTRCVVVTKSQFGRKMDKEVGHGSINKKIPTSILYNKNERILISFLKGYYDGDGYFNQKYGVLQATTVSQTLAQQLQTAWARLGYFAKISSFQRKRKRRKKNGTLGVVNKEYGINLNMPEGIRILGYDAPNKHSKNAQSYIFDDAIYIPIKEISFEYCETELVVISTQDESFLASNCISRNSGKDRASIMIGIDYFIECLNENRAVYRPDMVPAVYWWQIAPTEKMARQNWRELKQFFPKEWIVSISDSSYQIETIGGGVIEVRSGYSPEDLVGVGLDLVTITEGARFNDLHAAWANVESRLNSPGRGLAKDRVGIDYGQGKAIINSSPIGKNDFYDLFCYGQKSHSNYSSEWWSAQYPWTCNPTNEQLAKKIIHSRYGDITYEESLRRQLGERTFRSNYLADFLSEDGTVFKDFEMRCVLNIYNQDQVPCKTAEERKEFIQKWKEPIPGEVYCGGYDPATGSSNDSPAFVIRHKDTGNIVRVYDLYGKSYEQQYDFIAAICKEFNYADIHWLRTGHTAIEGEFAKRGIHEEPLDENGQKKRALVQTLELAVENGDVHVLHDGSEEVQTLIYQMNDYSEIKGKYSNNKQAHDDFVSAMYAAFSDYCVGEIPMAYCGTMKSF